MATSDKIFVDLDEEIVFTVEKIAQSASDRVIVVVPESANLVASLISLKLLSSQIARTDKLIVLVTEDKLGLKLSEKAGLVSKEKISQITPEVWVKAEEKKKAFLEERRKLKNSLISDRQETGSYEIVDVEEKAEDGEGMEEEEKNEKEALKTEIIEEPVISTAISQKPRLEPKVVNLGNIKVLAGGDIELQNEFQAEINDAPAAQKQPEIIEKKAEELVDEIQGKTVQMETNSVDETEEPVEKEEEGISTANLIGRDLSKIVPDNPRKRRLQQDFAREPKKAGTPGDTFAAKIVDRVKAFYSTGNTRLKIGGTVAGVVVVIGFLTMFVFNTASVKIYTKEQNIKVDEQISGKEGANGIDAENLIIPIYTLKLSENSSNTADATGNVNDGNKAQGLITIYNKTEDEISLPAGKVLENISTSNKYVLMAATTVPAAVMDGGGNLNLGVKKDVSIQAESFGEKYNTSGTANYKFDGFTTDQLDARSFSNVEGGDTSEETAVAEGDISDLENGLIDELQNRLRSELEDSVADDEYLLEDTISFGTPNSTSDHPAGEQADTVTVSLTLDGTAYFVKKDELKELVAEIIKSESDFEGSVDTNALDDIEPVDVVVDGDKVSFSVSTEGDVTAGFTEDEIAADLAGKSIGQAKEYLDSKQGVEEYKLNVGPFYLPAFLKSMPSKGKIKVDIVTK